MNVMLGSFAKKRNSTALPSGGQTSISGTLRAGCSIQNPIIGFAENRMSTPAAYNYAYITQFARYYFIQDWRWEGGLWWAYMEVDVMGSFKTPIGQSSCYVLRAASEYSDIITDSLYPTYSIASSIIDDIQDPLWDTDDFNQGTYVIGVIGQSTGGGAVNYYTLSPASMENLKNALLTTTDYIGTTEITTELLKSLVNPFQYIVSATWFPYTNIPSSGSQTIKFGWWTATGASGGVLSTKTLTKRSALKAHAHPSATRGYLHSAPYSKYTAFIAPFGEIELDPQIIANGMATHDAETYCGIDTTLYVDLVTGNGYLVLKVGDNVVAFRQGKIGVPVQLGQITQNVSGAIGSAFAGLGSALMGAITGNIAGAIVGTSGAILSGIQCAYGQVKTGGVDGGISLFSIDPHIETRFNAPVHEDITENGKPLCETRTISALSGYIKTLNADIAIPGATDNEQERIRAMMNGGFFYE